MYAENEAIDQASKTVKRQANYEWELGFLTLEAVFAARGMDHLKSLLDAGIYNNPKYQNLPKFRQVALQAYFRGVCDAIARTAGVQTPEIASVAPKSRPPKKTRKVSVKPKLHPTPKAPKAPLPAWVDSIRPPEEKPRPHARATILPPPPATTPSPIAAAPRPSILMPPFPPNIKLPPEFQLSYF